MIEAAACALPLVTTNVPGCREVVTDEKDGLLVQLRDVATLAGPLPACTTTLRCASAWAAAARKKALAEFDERIVLDKTLAVYAELV